MREDVVYVRNPNGEISVAASTAYESEAVLQDLIEHHPRLLSGGLINPERPPRWLLIGRECGIPGEESGSDRWSLDHLLVDQDAVPTFVEVKRSTDTRIRREVVGQMLDYAANAARYWPAPRIRSFANERYKSPDAADQKVEDLLGIQPRAADSDDVTRFWAAVEKNLRSGKVRLLFVADVIPPELRAIIELLNERMADVEVLGVEVRRYLIEDGSAVLVPRVIGQSQAAEVAKGRGTGSRTPLDMDALLAQVGQPAARFFQEIVEQATQADLVCDFTSQGMKVGIEWQGGVKNFLYAYPAGVMNKDRPFLSVFLGYVADIPVATALRATCDRLAGKYKAGDHTFNVPVDGSAGNVGRQLWASLLAAARGGQE